MPQISKRYIPEDKLDRIFNLFFDLISEVSDKKEAENILTEILTPTEKIMIAKRIACFYLFYKKISSSEIADTLKLSLSTVTHLKFLFDNSKITKEFLSRRLTNEKIKNTLKDIFVEIFYGTLKKGSDWSTDKKIYYQHKRQMNQPI